MLFQPQGVTRFAGAPTTTKAGSSRFSEMGPASKVLELQAEVERLRNENVALQAAGLESLASSLSPHGQSDEQVQVLQEALKRQVALTQQYQAQAEELSRKEDITSRLVLEQRVKALEADLQRAASQTNRSPSGPPGSPTPMVSKGTVAPVCVRKTLRQLDGCPDDRQHSLPQTDWVIVHRDSSRGRLHASM